MEDNSMAHKLITRLLNTAEYIGIILMTLFASAAAFVSFGTQGGAITPFLSSLVVMGFGGYSLYKVYRFNAGDKIAPEEV